VSACRSSHSADDFWRAFSPRPVRRPRSRRIELPFARETSPMPRLMSLGGRCLLADPGSTWAGSTNYPVPRRHARWSGVSTAEPARSRTLTSPRFGTGAEKGGLPSPDPASGRWASCTGAVGRRWPMAWAGDRPDGDERPRICVAHADSGRRSSILKSDDPPKIIGAEA